MANLGSHYMFVFKIYELINDKIWWINEKSFKITKMIENRELIISVYNLYYVSKLSN